MISAIAAINKHNTLGLDGKMPWHAPEDLQMFKDYTMGKTLIMGRKTYEGLPKALKGRNILVLSRDKDQSDIDDLGVFLSSYEGSDELIVAGGGEVYKLALPYLDRLVISYIKDNDVIGDTFFPEIDLALFKVVEEKEYDSFTRIIYERR